MEPASTIVTKLGGPAKVARIVGIHRTRVSQWKRPKEAGGTGGLIPFRYAPKLIEAASEIGEVLTAADFLPVEPAERAGAA